MELKVYDSVRKGEIDLAKSFLSVHKWLNENVRNILDESDAILQANYQLIYTMGKMKDYLHKFEINHRNKCANSNESIVFS